MWKAEKFYIFLESDDVDGNVAFDGKKKKKKKRKLMGMNRSRVRKVIATVVAATSQKPEHEMNNISSKR